MKTVTVGVVGAGAMGAGIAQVAAAAGHRVRLFDQRPEAVGIAVERMRSSLAKRVTAGKSSSEQLHRDGLLSQ